jgi:hypothetical protein
LPKVREAYCSDVIRWHLFLKQDFFAAASKAFDHKDAGVREAAKSVVLTLMIVSSSAFMN